MKRNSIASLSETDYRVVLAVASLSGILLFLAYSALTYRVGFPLDDAWIHQTYARNLALHGEWAFRLGQASAGSTSPLWTALLSIGFLIGLAPYVWTFFLGWVILCVMAIRSEQIARRVVSTYRPNLPWVGLFIALAWHLTWSAVSGMETLLHGLIVLIVLGDLLEGSRRYLALGLLAGLSVWVRPDGMTLLGPILFAAFLQETDFRTRGSAIFKVFIGFGILFVFYLLFNLALSGTPFPNTYYAKQAEYREYLSSLTMADRLIFYLLQILASPFIVILPGFVPWLGGIFRERNWGAVAGLIWSIGYIALYFLRLPAYQHGRYIIPAFGILYLYALLGFVGYISSERAGPRMSFLWSSIVFVVVLSFQIVGAKQNAQDVVFIETQMVESSQWVNENLPPVSILGVHDIGAIGYFTENPVVDLAGLVTPDVIPFIRDERRLGEYLGSQSADYLIGFPAWYPELTNGQEQVFVADNPLYISDDRMTIYHWKTPR